MHFHDEENGISYGREQVRDTTMTQGENAGGTVEEKKSEKGVISDLKNGNCNGRAITNDYPTLDSMNQGGSAQREYNPVNIYQVLVRDCGRAEKYAGGRMGRGGERRQRRLNISSSSATTSSMIGRSTGSWTHIRSIKSINSGRHCLLSSSVEGRCRFAPTTS